MVSRRLFGNQDGGVLPVLLGFAAALAVAALAVVGAWRWYVNPPSAPVPPPAASPAWEADPEASARRLLHALNDRLRERDFLKLLSHEVEVFPVHRGGREFAGHRETFRLPSRYSVEEVAADLDGTARSLGAARLRHEVQEFSGERRHVLSFGFAPDFAPVEVVLREIRGPRAALVLDDAGYHLGADVDLLYSLGVPLTLAVIPYLPFSSAYAKEAPGRGVEVICHLPMEGVQSVAPGDYEVYLTRDMEAGEVYRAARRAVESLPGCRGLNNHMGSLATADKRVVVQVLRVLQEKDLYFLDSLTTPESRGAELARRMGVPVAERTVFLDHEESLGSARGALRLLIEKAREKGTAVGIGHFRRSTLEAVRDMIPEFRRAGVELVYVSEIVK